MFRNKKQNKNQYGTFNTKPENKKNVRVLMTAFAAVIFVLGVGIVLYKNHNQPKIQSAVVETAAEPIPGWWYKHFFNSSVCDQDSCKPESDPDNDKLSNLQEYYYGTEPLNPRTVGDKLSDGELVSQGFDPSKTGHQTFDETLNPDNIMGESLVFNTDVKQIIGSLTDITKVKLPEIKTQDVIVSGDNSKQAVADYLNRVNLAAFKYFNFNVEQSLKTAQITGSSDEIDNIKFRAARLLIDLKTISVPKDAVQLHKYYIGLMSLVPSVISLPQSDPDNTANTSLADDIWYDNAQAYLVLIQKIAIEKQKLK
ncbi:MAG: hypothetical protein ABI643_02010 [Candidatus Doudnabacteria bacterium]